MDLQPGPTPRPRLAAAVLAAVALLGAAAAASQPVAERPRIGLALSGGGARGAAHIGVLKVLDALRVPVHCIAGTSMGAVVGGAFAAGNSPQSMQELIAGTDWGDVFSDSPPRGERAVRRRADDTKGLFAPEFGLRDGGLVLPPGVVAGVTIEGFLRRLAAPAAGIDDFDRLPIPYRAVAADIATGAEVVLARGSLMQAMRASMAIPGAVAPVEIDGRLLVDGGIANNLPIDALRGCADVVIAVNISTPPLRRDELGSALSIVGQLVNLLGKEKVDRQLAALGPAEVLVAPELGDISAASFDRQLEAIAAGEAAARAAAPALERYRLPETEYARLRDTQRAAAPEAAPIDTVRFEGLQRTNAEVLAGLLETRPGSVPEDERIVADLRRIYGRGDFEAVDYRIDTTPAGRALVIPVREKSTGPDYLRFGLGVASDFRDEAYFNLLVSVRRTWLNRWGAEWLTEAQVGRTNFVSTEFYQPLEPAGRWFVAPYLRASQSTSGTYLGEDRVAEFRVRDRRAGVDLGRTIGQWGEVRVGALWRQVSAKVSTGLPLIPALEVQTTGLRVQVAGDTLDAPWFPRSGRRLLVNLFATTGRSDEQAGYRRLDAQWQVAGSLGPHTVAATLAGGGGLGTRLPGHEGFTLGGPFQLSGYRIGRFAGERAALASLRYYNRQVRLPSILGSGAYLGVSAEAGRVERQFSGEADTGTIGSGSFYVAAETFLGPAFLGIGLAPGGGRAVYLLLGAP